MGLAVAKSPSLAGLTEGEQDRLRDLASLPMKKPTGTGRWPGAHAGHGSGPLIAAQACLPILNLGLDYYRGWRSVILYPEGFLSPNAMNIRMQTAWCIASIGP